MRGDEGEGGWRGLGRAAAGGVGVSGQPTFQIIVSVVSVSRVHGRWGFAPVCSAGGEQEMWSCGRQGFSFSSGIYQLCDLRRII